MTTVNVPASPTSNNNAPPPMTMEQAMRKAIERFGDRGTVGDGLPHSSVRLPCKFVGWKECARWQWLGMGATFEEAFASVRKVKTHYMDRLEFFQ